MAARRRTITVEFPADIPDKRYAEIVNAIWVLSEIGGAAWVYPDERTDTWILDKIWAEWNEVEGDWVKETL